MLKDNEDNKIALIGAFLSLFLTIIFLSFVAILIRISEREISPIATVFNRFWIATVALGVWNGRKIWKNRLNDRQIDRSYSFFSANFYTRNNIFLLLFLGLLLALDILCWAWSLERTTIANSTILTRLTPLFVTLGGWIVWRKNFSRSFLVGMIISVGGASAIGVEDLHISIVQLEGDFIALTAAIVFAGYLLILEQLRSQFDADTILFWVSAIATIFTLILISISGDVWFPYSWQGWFSVIILGLICQALGQGLLAYSLKALSSELVSILLLLHPILTAIEANSIFSEFLSLTNILSFLTILLGVYLSISSQFSRDEK